MPVLPPAEKTSLLVKKANIWFVSVRPDGRPHMTPIWFVYHDDKLFIGIDPDSVKSRNLKENPHVVMALEDGSHPLICEGTARIISSPLPKILLSAFKAKYDWDLTTEAQYDQVVEITPQKWLSW